MYIPSPRKKSKDIWVTFCLVSQQHDVLTCHFVRYSKSRNTWMRTCVNETVKRADYLLKSFPWNLPAFIGWKKPKIFCPLHSAFDSAKTDKVLLNSMFKESNQNMAKVFPKQLGSQVLERRLHYACCFVTITCYLLRSNN